MPSTWPSFIAQPWPCTGSSVMAFFSAYSTPKPLIYWTISNFRAVVSSMPFTATISAVKFDSCITRRKPTLKGTAHTAPVDASRAYINSELLMEKFKQPFIEMLLLRRFSGSLKKSFKASETRFLAAAVPFAFCITYNITTKKHPFASKNKKKHKFKNWYMLLLQFQIYLNGSHPLSLKHRITMNDLHSFTK